MSNVINFFDKVPKEIHEASVDRGYARHRAHHHQLQIERKRKLQLEQKASGWDERYAKANVCRQLLMECFPDMTEEELDNMELST